MLLVLDGMLLVGLALFAVAGARRGPWPEVVTLGGLLLGALLADEWGDAWGADLGSTFGFLGAGGARLLVRTLLFLVPLLVVGYGGARLLPVLGAPGVPVRLLGGLLAVFNGAAIFALLLRTWDYSQGAGSALRDDPGTLFLLNWAGWFPLVLALGGIVAVAWAVLSRPRRVLTPVTPSVPAPAPSNTNRPLPDFATKPVPYGALSPSNGASRPVAGEDPATPLVGRPVAASSTFPPDAPATASPAPPPAPAPSAELRCRTCNQRLAPGAAFCPNCGTPVPE